MKCDEVRERMPDVAAGFIQPTGDEGKHLERCASCAEELNAMRATMALLDESIAAVEDGMLEDPTALRERLTRFVEAAGAKPRVVFRVLFIAILGSPSGLPVFDSMAFLGPEKTLLRLRAARKLLENLPPLSG